MLFMRSSIFGLSSCLFLLIFSLSCSSNSQETMPSTNQSGMRQEYPPTNQPGMRQENPATNQPALDDIKRATQNTAD